MKNYKEIYSTDEAMVIAGISKPTILKYMKNGCLKYFGKGGRSGYFIKHSDLMSFIDKIDKKSTKKESIELKINLLKQEQLKKIIELAKIKQLNNEEILNLEILLLDFQIKELKLRE